MLKLMPMNVYDVAAQQAWLEDLAARGWFAVSAPGVFALTVFEKGAPKAVRYRLEPAPVKEDCPDPERMMVYRAMGWAYVYTVGKTMHLWRCDDPDAPELHTDPETEARAYDRLFRQQQWADRIGIAVLALYVVWVLYIMFHRGETWLATAAQGWTPLWQVIAALGFLLAVPILAFRQSWALRRYLRPLRAGVPAPHRKPYRMACWLTLAYCLMWTFYMASLCATMLEPNAWSFVPAETFDEPVPYVTEKGIQEVQAIRWDNWLTADQWWTTEDMGGWGAKSRYYHLRFPWLADDLVDSILAGYQENGWPVTAWEVPGLDGAWASTRSDRGFWFLVVRLGDQVWDISTRTVEPTVELAERYAAVLAEFQ